MNPYLLDLYTEREHPRLHPHWFVNDLLWQALDSWEAANLCRARGFGESIAQTLNWGGDQYFQKWLEEMRS